VQSSRTLCRRQCHCFRLRWNEREFALDIESRLADQLCNG